jgi:hypothetical protein
VPQRRPKVGATRLAITLLVIVLLATVLLVVGLLVTHRSGRAKAASGLDNQHGPDFVGYAYNGRSWSVTGPFGNGATPPSLLACANSKWCMALYVGQGTSPNTSWVFQPAAA